MAGGPFIGTSYGRDGGGFSIPTALGWGGWGGGPVLWPTRMGAMDGNVAYP